MKVWEVLGFEPKNEKLYVEAFTHKSYVNEHGGNSYERLEFMGDSVLQLLTTEFLYNFHPDKQEGELTAIRQLAVRTETLAKYAIQLKLYEFILAGKGEKDIMRDNLLSDIYESLLGALYMDGQHEVIMAILSNTIFKSIEDNEFEDDLKNYKSEFQELIQADDKRSISYEVIKEEGPQNDKIFTVIVKLDGLTMGQGKGSTKKEAENLAAKDALSKFELN